MVKIWQQVYSNKRSSFPNICTMVPNVCIDAYNGFYMLTMADADADAYDADAYNG